MPLFICFLPDSPNSADKRNAIKAEHLAAGQQAREAGQKVFGRAFVNDESGTPEGSFQIYRFATLEEAWAGLKADPYWIKGVWDQEKVFVKQLAPDATDDQFKVVTA